MSNHASTHDYLLLARGKWDPEKSKEEIQSAIDRFYDWYERLVDEGRFKRGHRLATAAKVVSRTGITDGPFAETKEIVGGYWFIVARTLQEAASIAAENPCLVYGLYCEIRPIDLERASAYRDSSETPTQGEQRSRVGSTT